MSAFNVGCCAALFIWTHQSVRYVILVEVKAFWFYLLCFLFRFVLLSRTRVVFPEELLFICQLYPKRYNEYRKCNSLRWAQTSQIGENSNHGICESAEIDRGKCYTGNNDIRETPLWQKPVKLLFYKNNNISIILVLQSPNPLLDKSLRDLQATMNDVGKFVTGKISILESLDVSQKERSDFQNSRIASLQEQIVAADAEGAFPFTFLFSI